MSLLEKPLKMVANHLVKDYGRIEDLKLDTTEKSARMRITLEGETLPIDLAIGHYEFTKKGDSVFVQLKDISCSRAWLHKLINNLQPETSLEVPESVARVLKFARMV